jgi:cell division protein FtsB
MPGPEKISFGVTVFNVPIQNGEMDFIVQQIRQKEAEIKQFRIQIKEANKNIENLIKEQLMVYQVQLNGSMNG